MNSLIMYVSWLVGPVLQLTLIIFMVQRKLHAAFPRFFSYVVFQIVKTGILFGIYRYQQENYFDAYWTGNAIVVEAIPDPKVQGVTCHLTHFDRSVLDRLTKGN